MDSSCILEAGPSALADGLKAGVRNDRTGGKEGRERTVSMSHCHRLTVNLASVTSVSAAY